MHNFRTKLSETDWTDVLAAPCTRTKYSHFINIIDTLHNKCFPLTKVEINPIKDLKFLYGPVSSYFCTRHSAMIILNSS